MNYTKGKWYVALNGKVMVKHDGEMFTEICQMPFYTAREADEMPESSDNAHLIAAAPLMYEALKAVDDYLSAPYPENMKLKQIATDKLVYSLNKAEGGKRWLEKGTK